MLIRQLNYIRRWRRGVVNENVIQSCKKYILSIFRGDYWTVLERYMVFSESRGPKHAQSQPCLHSNNLHMLQTTLRAATNCNSMFHAIWSRFRVVRCVLFLTIFSWEQATSFAKKEEPNPLVCVSHYIQFHLYWRTRQQTCNYLMLAAFSIQIELMFEVWPKPTETRFFQIVDCHAMLVMPNGTLKKVTPSKNTRAKEDWNNESSSTK